MYSVLRSRSQRDYLLFKFAIHTGIKLSELLNMSVQRLKSIESGNIKQLGLMTENQRFKFYYHQI